MPKLRGQFNDEPGPSSAVMKTVVSAADAGIHQETAASLSVVNGSSHLCLSHPAVRATQNSTDAASAF